MTSILLTQLHWTDPYPGMWWLVKDELHHKNSYHTTKALTLPLSVVWQFRSLSLFRFRPPPPPALLSKLLSLPPPPSWCSAEQYGSSVCLITLLQIPVCLLQQASASSQLLGRYWRFVDCVHCLLTRKRHIQWKYTGGSSYSFERGGIIHWEEITEKTPEFHCTH